MSEYVDLSVFGWAPGGYEGRDCVDCGLRVTNCAKGAWRCQSCAWVCSTTQADTSRTSSSVDYHTMVINSMTVEQHAAALANGVRAALHSVAGEQKGHRMTALCAFLFHLCQVEPERRDLMRAILTSVRDEVCGPGGDT